MHSYILKITLHSPTAGDSVITRRIQAFDLILASDAASRIIANLSCEVHIPMTFTLRKSRKK